MSVILYGLAAMGLLTLLGSLGALVAAYKSLPPEQKEPITWWFIFAMLALVVVLGAIMTYDGYDRGTMQPMMPWPTQ